MSRVSPTYPGVAQGITLPLVLVIMNRCTYIPTGSLPHHYGRPLNSRNPLPDLLSMQQGVAAAALSSMAAPPPIGDPLKPLGC